jgi:hypothetical protein
MDMKCSYGGVDACSMACACKGVLVWFHGQKIFT